MEYYEIRLHYYELRKKNLIKTIQAELLILQSKCKYIKDLLNDNIDLRGKKSNEIRRMLQVKNYALLEDSYNYLTKMTMDSVSVEAVQALRLKKEQKL